MLPIGRFDQLPLPHFQGPVASGLPFRRLGHLRRAANDNAILQSHPEDAANRGSELVDVALGIACLLYTSLLPMSMKQKKLAEVSIKL